jgi:pimeloyl-ACP methyl ester carboxylesterase
MKLHGFKATICLALSVQLVSAQSEVSNRSEETIPPPGRLVDIGGRKLHLLCAGKGTPTIILVAGGGAFAIDWTLVLQRIDSNTRVCAYDRAGLGWSDPGPAEETVEETVSDLHKLLRASREKGPYVLVGASIAGIFIQAYQHRYPGEVAALVFTNSSNRVGFAAKNKVDLIWKLSEDEIKSAFPFPPSNAKREIPVKAPDPFDRLPEKEQAMWLWLNQQMLDKWDKSPGGPESLVSWRREFLREFEASDKSSRPLLGKLPVLVLASDPAAEDSLKHSRDGAAARLDFLSVNTLHITASGSGHEIHLYQPERVVYALRLVIHALRNSIPLSQAQE